MCGGPIGKPPLARIRLRAAAILWQEKAGNTGAGIAAMDILVTIMAHNEERRIAACLDTMPLGVAGIEICVVVNGSSDRTAEIVRGYGARGVRLVEYERGGKSRSWNRWILDEAPVAEAYVFADGDAEFLPGTVQALADTLARHPQANAAAGLPRNGRRAEYYRECIRRDHGLFGDCYALSGAFVSRMRARGVGLPEDTIGDDGLIAAFANTDLGRDADRRDDALVVCEEGGFLCEPNRLTPRGLTQQAKRMTNYSLRHFQNRIISAIMRGEGAGALPDRLSTLYADWLPRLTPRLSPMWFVFDRRALARMAAAADG